MMITPEELAKMYYEIYEELAPQFDVNQNNNSATPWEEIPLRNRQLMACTCAVILKELGLG